MPTNSRKGSFAGWNRMAEDSEARTVRTPFLNTAAGYGAMRTVRRSVLLTAVFFVASVSPSLGVQDSDTAAVRRVVEGFAEYSQAGNLAALDTLFGAGRGVHIIEGSGVNHGWIDYRDNHLKPELDSFRNFRYTYSAVEPVVRGNVAWAAFRYTLGADTPNGHVEAEGRGTMILEKQQGRWVIVHMHTSGRRVNPSSGGQPRTR
jgi:hypothetical protein